VIARVAVRVQPGARTEGFSGREEDGVLKVRVREPAREGRANAAVERLLAECIGVPRNSVRVVRGAASRNKLVEVRGLEPEALEARLRAALEAAPGEVS
jgi:uncharacterized protein (TIGR00251 family)